MDVLQWQLPAPLRTREEHQQLRRREEEGQRKLEQLHQKHNQRREERYARYAREDEE